MADRVRADGHEGVAGEWLQFIPRHAQLACDRGAIDAGDHRVRESLGQASPTVWVNFVEVKGGNRSKLSDQKTVAGTRLQNNVAGLGRCQERGKGGKIDRRRELLPFDLGFAPDRMGRQALR